MKTDESDGLARLAADPLRHEGLTRWWLDGVLIWGCNTPATVVIYQGLTKREARGA